MRSREAVAVIEFQGRSLGSRSDLALVG